MNREMEIRSQIGFQEKVAALGGIIGESACREISSLICQLYECPACLLMLAAKYNDDKVSIQSLVEVAKNEYDNGRFNSEWFMKNTHAYEFSERVLNRKFDRWFLETTMRLYAEDVRNSYKIPGSVMNVTDAKVLGAFSTTLLIEREVLSCRYNKAGKEVKTVEQVAKLPQFACKPEYIEGIFEDFDGMVESADEDFKKTFIKVLHSKTKTEDGINWADSGEDRDDSEDILSEDVIRQLLS